MSDEVWSREEIESPCTRVCVIEPRSRLCLGCRRSIDEIAAWSSLAPSARRAIMDELPTREVPTPRRGGRAGRQRG